MEDEFAKYDLSEVVGSEILKVKEVYMNLRPLLSAIVSGMAMALLGYLSTVTDFWVLNWHQIISIAIASIFVSLSKYFGTNNQGNLVGVLPIAEPK